MVLSVSGSPVCNVSPCLSPACLMIHHDVSTLSVHQDVTFPQVLVKFVWKLKMYKVFFKPSPIKAINKGRLLHTEVQFVLIYLLRVTSSG